MSRIRPSRAPKSTSSPGPPLTLRGMASNGAAGSDDASGPRSCTGDPPSTATTTFSPDTAVSKASAGGFETDASSYGAVNPLFLDTDDECLPEGLPLPLRPTIPSSQSMPSMSQTLTLVTSPIASSVECYAVAAPDSAQQSPVTPSLTPPPNTPLSPLSTPSSPKRRKTPKPGHSADANPLSPDLVPPPNTPLSPGSYPTSPHQTMGLPINEEETSFPEGESPGSNGPLDNILSPDPVDLTNLRPLPGVLFPGECKRARTEFLTENMNKAEDVIKELVTLGNGVYDEGSEDRNGNRAPVPRRFPHHLVKPGDWSALQERENRIAACWNHNLRTSPEDRRLSPAKNALPLAENKLQKSSLSPSVRGKHSASKSEKKKGTKSSSSSSSAAGERKPLLLEQRRGWDFNKGSRYKKLKIPMIDDEEDNYRKPDSPASSSSSTFSLGLLSTDGAAQLAEQLCDVTSEAGRLITQEVRETSLTADFELPDIVITPCPSSASSHQGIEYLTQPEDTLEFSWIDALTGLVSIATFYFDLVSDSLAVYYMHDDPDAKYYFFVTLMLLVLPLIIANGFSLYWYWFDERVCEPEMCYRHPRVPNYVWLVRVVAHLLLQASVLRQIDIVYYGTKSTRETVMREALVDEVMEEAIRSQEEEQEGEEGKEEGGKAKEEEGEGSRRRRSEESEREKKKKRERREQFSRQSSRPALERSVSSCSRRTGGACSKGGYLALWIHAERDAANVDLLLSLLQDAPLLILHLFIMTRTLPEQAEQGHLSQTIIWQIISVSASLLTLAWSVASFVRATRLCEPSLGNLSILDLVLLTLSHFCSIAGQVMSFALFASKLLLAFVIVALFHWVFMSFWVLSQLLCFPRTAFTRASFAHDRQRGLCHQLDDVLYAGAMGMVFLFTFVDVGGVAPKTQSLLYHVLRLLEEAVLLTVWFIWVEGSEWYHWLPIFLVPVLFCLNLAFDTLLTVNSPPNRCVTLSASPVPV